MDVHAPMEPIHTWRDIALHLGVVTVGLFIALSLEAFVEHIHNRHLVTEARANIREELQINHEATQDDVKRVQLTIDGIQANINTIRRLQTNPKDFHGSITNIPPAELNQMLRDNAAAEIDLFTLKQYLVLLDQQLVTELKQ